MVLHEAKNDIMRVPTPSRERCFEMETKFERKRAWNWFWKALPPSGDLHVGKDIFAVKKWIGRASTGCLLSYD